MAIGKYQAHKKLLLSVGIIINLALLLYFKYAVFLIRALSGMLESFGFIPFTIPEIWLPIGISFFTFQGISYLMDLYKGDIEPEKNFIDLGMYIALFPQLIAGPIVRYQSIHAEIKTRKPGLPDVEAGLKVFIIGLSAKVLLANPIGKIANAIYSAQPDLFGCEVAWLGGIAYSFQIYFDFAGYSTMALGLGKALGFTFPINFNFPYIAKSVTEFWRRWHITLSSWFRDYVYIPLGGNRKGKIRTCRNLILVFVATGFWHGANWTFLIWGLWHGFFIVVERYFRLSVPHTPPENHQPLSPLKALLAHSYLLLVVILGWVFFRSSTITEAFNHVYYMFDLSEIKGSPLFLELFNSYNIFLLCLCCFFCIPAGANFLYKIVCKNKFIDSLIHLFLFILTIISLVSQDFNPFLYFRF